MVAEAVEPGKRGPWLRAERLLRSTGIGTVTGRYWPVVRFLEYRLKPGEKEKAHSHPAGVLFTLSNARLRMTQFPTATVSDDDTHAGEVNWQDAVTHSAENIGASEFHSFRVELKPCKQP
jgi:hypothetical protein